MILPFSFAALSTATVRDAAGHEALSALLWTLAGDSTGAPWSHFSYSGDLRLFSLDSSSAPRLHLSSPGLHPTVCRAGREQTQAAPSEVLLHIQVTDYTWPRQSEAKQRHLK